MKKPGIFFISFFLFFCLQGKENIQFGAFDPSHWNGLVILKGKIPFAFRFVICKEAEIADGYDTFYLVDQVGPFAPDGGFAEVSFNPWLPFGKKKETPINEKRKNNSDVVRLRYSGIQSGIVGCLNIPEGISIKIVFYTPWQPSALYRPGNGVVIGENVKQKFWFVPKGGDISEFKSEVHHLSGSIQSQVHSFCFYAGFKKRQISASEIEYVLKNESKKYDCNRPKIQGEWSGVISSLSNNLFWMKLYQPDYNRIYIPAGRRWIFPRPDGSRDLWTIFEWDAFFNALLAVIEDTKMSGLEIEAVLDCQFPSGNIPNWRSAHSGSPDRSQPPVGSFAVLKIYYRTKDLSLLKRSYKALKKWHYFWKDLGENGYSRRDGNQDGLLEWGSDKDSLFAGMPEWEKGATGLQRAAWESGQDDLPNFDDVPFDEERGTMKMNCIDLNSLYALDSEMMMSIASILGKKDDARQFKQEYEDIKNKINEELWNGDFYYDRFWDKRFSSRRAASNFYTLLAGIPDPIRVKKVLKHLTSSHEFWGDYVIPTISRDNPAFKDQQYWRGTIWPPTNYLVYQGLKRYKLDSVASEFARKSASLFLKSWHNYGLCRENYNSITGEGGGQRYQSWGPLFSLILLEEFIDVCPFHGFRVGNLAACSPNKIKNIKIGENIYELEADKRSLELIKNRSKILEYKGRAVLRDLEISKKSIKFEANVISDKLDFYPLLFSGKTLSIVVEVTGVKQERNFISIPRGCFKIEIREGV